MEHTVDAGERITRLETQVEHHDEKLREHGDKIETLEKFQTDTEKHFSSEAGSRKTMLFLLKLVSGGIGFEVLLRFVEFVAKMKGLR